MLKKNILYVSEVASIGGAELSLLDILLNLDKEQFKPFFACSQSGPLTKKISSLGIEVNIIPLYKVRQLCFWRFLISIRKLVSFITKNKIDIIHANGTRANFLAVLAGKIASVPVIWHARNMPALGMYIDLEKHFTWLPQLVIANSHATAKRFKTNLNKLVVIYNGIDLEKFNPQRGDDVLRREFNISREVKIVAVVGRLGPGKGQDIFLKAVSLLKDKVANVKYFIVGGSCFEEDTNIEQFLKSQVVALGIEEDVIFTGFREDIPKIMSSLDIFVCPSSIIGEPFGRVLVEAMAAGKPIIATEAGGIPEVVEKDVTGILIPMRDSLALAKNIRFLIDNPRIARDMGEAGRRRVEQLFNLKDTIKQIEKLYFSLLLKPGERY